MSSDVKLLRPVQVALMLGVAPRTLSLWRVEGKGPGYIKVSPRIYLYPVQEVEKWLEDQMKKK